MKLTLDKLPPEVLAVLGDTRALRALPQGMTSTVVMAETANGPRVLKRARGALFTNWLEKERHVLTTLSAAGLPVPAPFGLVSMDSAVVPECWLVMEQLPGQPLVAILSQVQEPSERAALLREFGRTLAAIHATPAPAGMSQLTPSWLDAMLEDAAENLEHFNVDGTPELLARLRAHKPRPVPPTLIHGDYNFDNVLVDGDHVTGIIDWSGGAIGDPRYDLALATRPQVEAFSGADRPSDLSAFYDGYGGQPLEPFEADYFIGLYEFF